MLARRQLRQVTIERPEEPLEHSKAASFALSFRVQSGTNE
ncbi:hypothetical protein MESS2_280009 [Mesorhizobium metallidurans STM 2683]|uniref:Uncharacterized protein n=1 Tax=Mesorhizobium metallidurans STM 2683 TaxID=1297569 RepID=M5EP55_9HYPH|nr:hypothetical protein MESS2_280009 [Mesorhizobium metallidurans STM 2683]